jgi:hypothetical protein
MLRETAFMKLIPENDQNRILKGTLKITKGYLSNKGIIRNDQRITQPVVIIQDICFFL